jgi:hypothetical protein
MRPNSVGMVFSIRLGGDLSGGLQSIEEKDQEQDRPCGKSEWMRRESRSKSSKVMFSRENHLRKSLGRGDVTLASRLYVCDDLVGF